MNKSFEEPGDEELYESYDSYKALIDAGVSEREALEKTGLTAQIVKDLKQEEEEMFSDSNELDEWDNYDFEDEDNLDKEIYDEGDDDWDYQDSSYDEFEEPLDEDY